MSTTGSDVTAVGRRLPLAAWVIATAVTVALLLVAGRYGFHGDEFYFVVTGRHLQAAAPDNPMVVPYLAAGWYAVVGGHLWAFRILPALAAGCYALLGGLIAREWGLPRAHQIVATAAVAMTAIVLGVGHLFETTTFDMVVSATAMWMLIRALRAEPQRWRPWLAVGVLIGISMEIKVLAAIVFFCCLLGVLIAGPRRRLLSPKLWSAVATSLVLAAPNLVWQAVHGFPMAAIAANIAAGGSTSSTSRPSLLPIILLDVGPVISVVLIVGLVWLLREARRPTAGWLAVALMVFVALMVVTGGKAYYPAAFFPAVLAAGAGPVLEWVGRRRWRTALAFPLLALSLVITPVLTLPVSRPGSPLYRIALGPNPDLASELGWPGFVDQVGLVAARIPSAERADTIVLTSSYQEAGALTLLRPADGTAMPPVYSGHNGFWYWGPPPESATDAIIVADVSAARLSTAYARCTLVHRVISPPAISNDESGVPIHWCTGRLHPWSVLWPKLQTLG